MMAFEKSPDSRASQLWVWAKEAKKKEEELMFLKQKSSEKMVIRS